ncbi:DUF1800 domain-containing protein [Marilutibacter spongiae]|uniref:DUF1800 domain-containing protein n=1 Tax=Marilutibacter spongiae TaxID=2025720 RepID=A0A7W3TML5_9GAMM|nr:DUF1800 domain-containing protein [Lysobacter spongiae]MBB1060724.1 DUF1800 domain-containing protein [Lysobacter spongiae]
MSIADEVMRSMRMAGSSQPRARTSAVAPTSTMAGSGVDPAFLARRYGNGVGIPTQGHLGDNAGGPASTAEPHGVQAPRAARSSPPALLTLARPPFAVRMLSNLSYGITPQALSEFNALGGTDADRLANWVDWQLDWTAIDDSAVESRLSGAGYTTLGKSLAQLWSGHVLGDPEYDTRMRPAWEIQRAAFVRATHSRRQLREVVVNFWHDHFNVTAGDYSAGPVYVHYDRDVIRKHALGNFRSMLEAVATSPAMLYYLDNVSNTRAGPNENWARELLELHTFGAANYLGFMDPFAVPPDPIDPGYPSGYTDIDVYETASAFTGWTMKNGHWEFPDDNDGSFVYRQSWHDAGPKFVLGKLLNPEQPAMKDGRDILDRLASHPAVARFVCSKLIRRFVGDEPSESLVRSAASVFRQNWQRADQIERVLRHILNSSPMYNAWGQKARRPFEAIVAAMRATGSDWTLRLDNDASNSFMWRLGFTGHEPYAWPAPNGYPDTEQAWTGANSLAMDWKLLNWLTEARDADVPLLPILATTRAQVPQWTATRLVDYWCNRILGRAPASARRQLLIGFMAQNGDPASHLIADTNAWAGNDLKNHYNQERLRSMVSLILMSPEFLSR